MEPIVSGIKKKYASCMKLVRVNFHDHTPWHDLLYPFGSPEFALLDTSKTVIYRWFGVVEATDFAKVLDPLC